MHSNGMRTPRALSAFGISQQPAAVDGEHIIGVPDAVGIVAFFDVLQFIGSIFWRPAAVRIAENAVAAPRTGVGAAACMDHTDHAMPMMGLPGIHILLHVDSFRGLARDVRSGQPSADVGLSQPFDLFRQ